MRIGVTGGAGYIGSNLIWELLKKEHEIVSIDNQSIGDYKYLRENTGKQAELIEGDIRDIDLLLEKWSECEAIAHLAALAGLDLCTEKPEEAVSVNIYGTYQVMEAARILDIPRVVFCSSAAIYGEPINLPVSEEHPKNPLNLYGVTKLAGEKILDTYYANYDLETVNLRFGNVYGIGLYTHWDTVIPKFVKQAYNGDRITVYGDGEYSRDLVHVQDICKAIILGIKTHGIGGESFNVGGEVFTVNEITEIIKKEIKKSKDFTPETVNTTPRRGETKKFSYDLDKIKTKLGFENDWSVKKGVKQIIEFLNHKTTN